MKNTTLVYIEQDGSYLMLYRNRKEHDVNHGKWIGVGGKMEYGESPEECMRREVREETGLEVDTYRYAGILTFRSDNDDMEYIHLFTVNRFHSPSGKMKDCDEGELRWLKKSEITHIPHWIGDRIFLSLILNEKVPFFSLKLVYEQGVMKQAVLNEHNCIVTDRLILRPWLECDSAYLFAAAKNPGVALPAGFLPHKDAAQSREIIRRILSRPEIYAIVERDHYEPVGSVGLQNFRIAQKDGSLISFFDERKSQDPVCVTRQVLGDPEINAEAELGYWLSEETWHKGYMQEAAGALMEHGYRELGLNRIWCCYYEGNERSKETQKKLGFHYHHTNPDKLVEPLGEKRVEIVNVKARADDISIPESMI